MDRSSEPLKASDKSQRARFLEAARELGTDEDEAAFKAKLAVIAKQKPKGVDHAAVSPEDDPK